MTTTTPADTVITSTGHRDAFSRRLPGPMGTSSPGAPLGSDSRYSRRVDLQRPPCLGVDDHDGAGRVEGALQAHRAEHHPREAASTPGSDDQQVGARSCLDETGSTVAVDHDGLDLQLGIRRHLRQELVDALASVSSGSLLPSLDLGRIVDPTVGHLVTVNDNEASPPLPRLVDRPAQSQPRTSGVVDTDHDPVHSVRLSWTPHGALCGSICDHREYEVLEGWREGPKDTTSCHGMPTARRALRP